MATESVNTVTEPAQPRKPALNRRLGFFALIALLIGVLIGYFSYVDSREDLVNNDYYRVLYEASNKLNENLSQLRKMHVNKESLNSIRTQLPSYKRKIPQNSSISKNLKFVLKGQSIKIRDGDSNNAEDIAEIRITDILPTPKRGFSQYLFASNKGKVLAVIGDEKTISIDTLTSVSKEIEKNKRRFQFKLNQPTNNNSKKAGWDLPSFSSHVDMKLSHEEFRIFIFPFSLATPLIREGVKDNLEKEKSTDTNADRDINTLYLVGLLPKYKLHTEGSEYRDLPLLLVALIFSLFVWALLRLYLLPKNQSISSGYRRFTMASSYGFIIALIALLLAFMQKTALQANKDHYAAEYGKKLASDLEDDLKLVFDRLDNYRAFYQKLITGLDQLPSVSTNCLENPQRPECNEPATKEFSNLIKDSLNSIVKSRGCSHSLRKILPSHAFTHATDYRINKPSEDKHCKFNLSDIKLDRFAEEVLLKAYQNKPDNLYTLGFVAGNQIIAVNNPKNTDKIYSYLSIPEGKHYIPDKILGVTSINDEGKITLPPIFYRESNAPPLILNLTHRDYYKKVRSYQGWHLDLCDDNKKEKNGKCVFENVYIQRVLNISDGTRGTTISMPMVDQDSINNRSKPALAYTLTADVILPSVSLAAPAPYDFIYMVIERNSGDVLFHSDESRTLVENLYYSGNNQSNLGEWLKTGLDRFGIVDKEVMSGHYHGQPGRFKSVEAPVDEWAIVIFYPDESLDVVMAKQFLIISVNFAIVLLLFAFSLYVIRKLNWASSLKNRLSIPETINGRKIFMAVTILICVIYTSYYTSLLLTLDKAPFDSAKKCDLQSIAGILIVTGILIFFLCKTIRSKKFIPVVILLSMSILKFCYLYTVDVGQIPLKTLEFHYQQVDCNWLNYERQESIKMAISRYPNSITDHRIHPITLLPMTELQESLDEDKSVCQNYSSQTELGNHLSLNSLIDFWQWIYNLQLVNSEPPASKTIKKSQQVNNDTSWWHTDSVTFTSIFTLVVSFVMILLIIWFWYEFTRQTLWKRLYCSDRFLQHIKKLTQAKFTQPDWNQYHSKLIIECDRTKLNGIDLTLLLGTAAMHNSQSAESRQHILLTGFDTLYQLSPCLQRLGAQTHAQPDLKLNVEQNPANKELDVQIWDIEACLAQPDFRQNLLDLIMEMKSLTLANQLNSFTIYAEHHNLQRIKIKDPLQMNCGSVLKHAEYLSWAECLMDFNVKVAKEFERQIDQSFLMREIADFPELSFLSREPLKTYENTKEDSWNKHRDATIEARLTTIHYILMRAGALYRFKWESCSNAEKLALLNLDKQQRLNPSNTQMIEHLAVNGLIKVEHGRLEIVNNSFAYFVRNAETADTINQLVREGEAGVWKDYRLPIGLLMILIIGGITLVSGEAVSIVTASVVGIIGAITSVIKSTSMFKEQARE
ncbi:hypothetical protein [Nitrosomonas marina]|uniref:Uncharacterized protein n=1 Tax=Nitrosomonas marina TaxID=917 RepID=A0A1H8BCT8_9PROT|nr:hypothetical protein [Nitrosomonas marina]SEM80632.1 hypothetical protein SAMN05216325_102210 [Nitrosomonas marina]